MGVGYNTSIVRDGLILYLDAANSKSYPGSGTTFFNLKQINNSNLVNGVTYNSSNNGYFSFDGLDDFISVGNIDLRNISYSISTWVKPQDFNRLNPIVGDLQFNWFGLYFNNNILIARHRRQSDNFQNQVTYTIQNPSSQWYFITMIFDIENGMRLYINTELVASNTSTAEFQLVPPRGLQYIGRHSLSVATTQNYFLGEISYFSTYNKALTPEEVKLNFEATRGRYGI